MTAIRPRGAIAHAPPTVSAYLVDAWLGSQADTSTIPSRLAGGSSLTLQGTTTGFTANVASGYATLNGTDNWLETPAAAAYNCPAGGSMIVVLDSALTANAGNVTSFQNKGALLNSANPGMGIRTTAAGVSSIYGGDQNNLAALTDNPIDDGARRHMVLCFSIGEYRECFINGALDATSRETVDVVSATPAAAVKATIGAAFDGGSEWGAMAVYECQMYATSGVLPSNIAQIAKWLATHRGQLLPASLW